jgi:hypothetical protein
MEFRQILTESSTKCEERDNVVFFHIGYKDLLLTTTDKIINCFFGEDENQRMRW